MLISSLTYVSNDFDNALFLKKKLVSNIFKWSAMKGFLIQLPGCAWKT